MGDLLRLLGGSPDCASSLRVLPAATRVGTAIVWQSRCCSAGCSPTTGSGRRNSKPATSCELLDQEAGELATQVAAAKICHATRTAAKNWRAWRWRDSASGPAGETLAQAQDRLTTLNSAERARVMKAAQAAEQRARQIREELARKAAEESADKWTRE